MMDLKAFLKTLSFMHISLVAGLVIFTLIAVAQGKGFNTSTEGADPLLYVVPVVALLGYFGSQAVFKKMISKVTSSDTFEYKLKKYQSATHIRYILIEAPAFLSLFVYYSTGNALPLIISFCLLVYLFAQRPNKSKIIESLPLTNEERQKFQF
ncbi:hypothetical protein ACOCEA_09940 [Maribacter sp. CXY002]|uniref:hypothetical protein n=1 Tax=Maribacter luteocoastalis TaxID=3407671 RepID=UPI003B6855D6